MKQQVSVEEYNILNDRLRDKIEEISILTAKVNKNANDSRLVTI